MSAPWLRQYDRHNSELYRYAWRLLGDADLAEECVAETFSRFLTALQRGGGPRQHLRAYLFRMAHNWITDYYRSRPTMPLPLMEHTHVSPVDISGDLEEQAERAGIRVALAELTPDQRQVIVLKYVEDWNTEDIARALGKPVGAVKALQHRAIQSLRRLLLKEKIE